MLIEGKKNLEFVKRALNSHLVHCSKQSLNSSDELAKSTWDPEIMETNAMLDAVERNLNLYNIEKEEPAIHTGGVDFFR